MQLRFVESAPLRHDTPILAVGVFEGERQPASGTVASFAGGQALRALERGDIKGRADEEVLLYADDPADDDPVGPRRLLLRGLGPREEFDAESARRMAGRLVRAAERIGLTEGAVALAGLPGLSPERLAQAATEGAALAAWRFVELKTPDPDRPVTVVRGVDLVAEGDGEAFRNGTLTGAAIARGENTARTLQSRPGNVATSTHLAEEAERIARAVGIDVRIFDEARMVDEGMHAILAVSGGSSQEARFIILRHDGGEEGQAPLVLVGKGLTFDAGGISLKPPPGMEDMKFDMSGGAAVIGAMQAIAELGLPLNVVGLVAASENLPSGSALKPGDVIRTLAGKTVEVINTDAEGRLLLADALAYGARLGAAAMVDCATLTGAVVIALGRHCAAVLGNDDALVAELTAAGEVSGERCWQLPLWKEYRKQLDSDTADLQNVGGRPAGSITAAAFLKEFVGDATWAHLDIAGTAYGEDDRPYRRKGGYGFPTRLLVEWVRSRAG